MQSCFLQLSPAVAELLFLALIVFSGFYFYTWWRSLRPVNNRGGGVLIRLHIKSFDLQHFQNFPLFFTGQTTPLTKLPTRYFFLLFSIFQSAPLTKLFPIFIPPIFTGQTTPLTKLFHPLFSTFPLFFNLHAKQNFFSIFTSFLFFCRNKLHS